MNEKLIKVGIAQGDINGISYEVILKTLEDSRIFEFCIPIIYGSSKIMAYHKKMLDKGSINVHVINHTRDVEANRVYLINCINSETLVELSHQTKEGAEAAAQSLHRAIQDLNAGLIDILLMSPAAEDHTSLIEQETGKEKKALKILVKESLRVALVTNEVSFAKVSDLLNVEMLTEKIKATQAGLVHDFMITSPRIAVLSLNPDASINGKLGKEEEEIIVPAMKAATEAGVFCFGPYSADVFFSTEEYVKFDAIISMYYNQIITPFRTITLGEGVCYIAGLPYVIAAPDQDVSYEAAGKNISPEAAFRNALYLSVDLFKNREQDREIFANPLRKIYIERGSDNEKLDLTKD